MTQNLKALIVDDDRFFSSLIKTYLTMLGITSKVSINGIDALKILKNEHFDFMITDFQMPQMNGLTLLKEIKYIEKLSHLKTIFVTGGGQKIDELHQAEELADQSIFKPFTLETLEQKIKELNLTPRF